METLLRGVRNYLKTEPQMKWDGKQRQANNYIAHLAQQKTKIILNVQSRIWIDHHVVCFLFGIRACSAIFKSLDHVHREVLVTNIQWQFRIHAYKTRY